MVDRIRPGFRGDLDPVLRQILHFLLARQLLLTGRRDDLQLRRKHPEGNIESDLVVPGRGRAVRQRGGPDLDRIQGTLLGLHDPFRRDAQWIHLAAERVRENQVAQIVVEQLAAGIDRSMLRHAQRTSPPLDRGDLIRVAVGLHGDGMDLVALLAQPDCAVGRVQPAGKRQDCFWLCVH
jgi:hypothetical protein